MSPTNTDYAWRRPLETALAALEDLQRQWYDLAEPAHNELGALLADFRVRLYQAEGDTGRGAALVSFLYELEAAPSLPVSVAQLLASDHRPPVRSILTLESGRAREIIDILTGLIGPNRRMAPSREPAGGDETFPEAAKLAERVIRRINNRWTELSLRGQDQAATWLDMYDSALYGAADDVERLLDTYNFLGQIKSDPEIYALVENEFTVRHGGETSWQSGGAAMSAVDAGKVRQLIGSSTLMATPKTPFWVELYAEMAPAEPHFADQGPEPVTVTFHTDVRFPGQVRTFDRAIPLRVRLTLEKAEGTVVDESVSVEFAAPEPQPVLVVCAAEGFIEETGDLTRTIMVYRDRDSQTAVFLLTPDPATGPGVRRITLDFYHRERPAGAATFQVEVRDRPPVDETPVEPEPVIEDLNPDGTVTRVAGSLSLAAGDAAPPDLVLRIILSADRRGLSYVLHSPTGKLGLVHQRMGSKTLESDPRAFMENTLQRLSQMARASKKKLTEAQFAENQEKLREIGWDLYEQLFTPALRRAYRALRLQSQEKPTLSLLIVSDEPWIPWEMILPHEDDLPNEDFLCAQFRMTRWLPGWGLPEEFGLQQARVVTPKSNLASVKREQDFFSQDLPRLRPEISLGNGWLSKAAQVKEALRQGNVQWFHFACHGDFDYTLPDESALQLEGEALTPKQIVGPMRSGVAASRPLVFLNACHTAEAGFSLTRMGGWAERFVRAGASAFIGSLWEVNDELAAEFAIKFYSELLTGQTLGDAFHTARLHIRALDEANPTWLAYTLYADPNGKIQSR